jgi:hypothetical protein
LIWRSEPERNPIIKVDSLASAEPMKIASFNINNINQRFTNLLNWLREADPDIVCLQETKASDTESRRRCMGSAGFPIDRPDLIEQPSRRPLKPHHRRFLPPISRIGASSILTSDFLGSQGSGSSRDGHVNSECHSKLRAPEFSSREHAARRE